MQLALRKAPPACWSDAPLSIGKAWPASLAPSGTTLSGARMPSLHPPLLTPRRSSRQLWRLAFCLSALMAALILHFNLHVASCLMRLLCRKDARLAIRRHVALFIQSFPCFCIGFGFAHLAASALNAVVSASFDPSGRDSGSFWCLRRYFFSRPPPPPSDNRNNCTMIGVEEAWEVEPHAHEQALVLLCSCQNVVWLQVVPRCPPFLAPGPSCPCGGPLRGPEPISTQQVNQTQLVEQVNNDLLPLVTGEPNVDVQVPHDKQFAPCRATSTALQISSTPLVQFGGMYLPTT
jgi:hypothetical protein